VEVIYIYWFDGLLSGLQGSKQMTVSHVRNMKMNDDVLVVAVSPDAKYIAVALLDCTVKVMLSSLNILRLTYYLCLIKEIVYFTSIFNIVSFT